MNQGLPVKLRMLPVLVFILLEFVIQPSNAQSPKREFRAVWVATVANIDWPSLPGLSSEEQKQEIISVLDLHQANGINAIILQVRPTADAIYPSDLEPWSRFLSGEQGVAPEPWYDPLNFWIEESHRRGMELHAWFNPYRIKMSVEDSLAENHIALKHPEWCFDYGERSYFSPADSLVWEFVTSVVVDVVRRYDIDAVHFDDYFYPYAIKGETIPDSLEFAMSGDSSTTTQLDAWRRQNVDTIIEMLHLAIKSEKPWVKFGISPFGVWRNRLEDPLGSETAAGTSNYDGLYADVIKWQQEGWIDYLMPQIYWRDDHPVAGFSTLAYWWNDQSFGRSVYVGLAPYRISKKSDYKMWRKDKYLLEQIELLRELEGVHGFGYFSSKHFFRSDLARLNKKIRKDYCPRPALVPGMPWIDSNAPEAPFNLTRDGESLRWDVNETLNEMDRSRFYVLYRYEQAENSKLKRAENMILVTGESFADFSEGIKSGVYRVTSLDRLSNESQLSNPLIIN
ncbi:MAG: family 10 glycosylhydrolase [Bacteroidetes bacterium]|nr:family 10 glycosylhydrolase [Bacteroidota bacterium]